MHGFVFSRLGEHPCLWRKRLGHSDRGEQLCMVCAGRLVGAMGDAYLSKCQQLLLRGFCQYRGGPQRDRYRRPKPCNIYDQSSRVDRHQSQFAV